MLLHVVILEVPLDRLGTGMDVSDGHLLRPAGCLDLHVIAFFERALVPFAAEDSTAAVV
jgi:hypothetical protein